LVWSGAWGLAGRLLVGERRFAGHLTAAALTVLGYLLLGNWDYVAFAFSAPGLRHLMIPATAALLAWGLWRHLSLVTRNPGRGVALAAVAVAAVSVGSLALYFETDRADDLTRMGYLKAIKTPLVRLASGREAGKFFRDAEKLRGELEPLKTR
jgi:putative effector of murein hydrolase